MSSVPVNSPAQARRRLLVVDDNEPSRYATVRILRAAGFDTMEAGTGSDALRLATGDIDLVVLDVNLPDIDGFDVCRQLRAGRETADLPICYLSATFTANEDIARGMSTGADGYLTHPSDPLVLVATVRALLFIREANAQKRLADARFRAVFDLAQNGICMLDAEMRFTEVNPSLGAMLGREPADLVNEPLRGVISAEQQPLLAQFEAALHQNASWNGILRLNLPSGDSIDTEWQVTPGPGSALGIAMVTDVTARLRLETAREHYLLGEQAARAEAERSNQLKDEFLATLSHELRNPLNAILGWAEVLKRTPNVPAELARGIDAIDRNSRVQAHLISDLLDFAGIRFGKMRLEKSSVDPNQALRAAVEVVASQAEAKGVKFRIRLLDHPVTMFGDEARLQQIFWNLLTNAIKFTPAGGEIEASASLAGHAFQAAIRDTGRGISPDFLPRLFDRFSQQDSGSAKNFAGLGIGLTIVRHLVNMHGGTITVASAGVGRGACFTVCLPLAQGAALARGVPAERSLSGVRILVVEDLEDTRALIHRLLCDAGAEVTEAADVQRALDSIDARTPDILISDIGMPHSDGYQLIRTLRSQGYSAERLPAIALTAFVRNEDESDALEAGYQIHLSKPVNADMLIGAVSRLVSRYAKPSDLAG
jgi:PAS domain S-box-containing protein